MNAVIRLLITAAALAVAAATVPGIELQSGSAMPKALTLIVVALVTGIVSLRPRPYTRGQGYAFYILFLGAAGLAVNGLLLWLASWVAGELSMPFRITGFWPAVWGALIVASAAWLADLAGARVRRRPARAAAAGS